MSDKNSFPTSKNCKNFKNILVKGVREAAYKTIVRPQLEYASTTWSPYSQTYTQKIEMVQRRVARWTMNDYSPYSSVTQMQQNLGWQSLEQRRSDFKIIHDRVAIQISSYFKQPIAATRHSLRHPLAIVYRQIHTSANY